MEAGLFTLRFVITGMSTKKAAEICNTSEQTYKKWESTRIYPIHALDLIKASAGITSSSESVEQTPCVDDGLEKVRMAVNESFQGVSAKVINFPND